MIGISVLLAVALAVNNGPQFRGPGSSGASGYPDLPVKWHQTENVLWKAPVAGLGWSSPVVCGDRIFLSSVESSDPKAAPKKGLYFGGERPAPSGEHRWFVHCVDVKSGKTFWRREVHRGAPPVLQNGRLYIVNDGDDKIWLIAPGKVTAKQIWQVDRGEKCNWSTPFIRESAAHTELIATGTNRVRSNHLDGKVLWEPGGMSSIVIPCPFTQHDSGYVADRNRPIFALSEDGDTYVIQAGAEYKLLGKNSLDERCMATPAIARSNPIMRTASNLYRIGK